jgi:hypothetical protein
MGKRKAKPSTLFGAPAVVGQKSEKSLFFRVGKNEIAEANQAAQEMGCGTPFGEDGKLEGTRAEKKRYMQEINRRRADLGEPRLVNFDGGYGDET